MDAERRALLQVDHVQQYYGGSHILRDVGFSAAAGEVTVVLGRNGVGKTKLLESLMGVVPVRSGTVRFAGADITAETPFQRARRGIGYVPQGREIFARLTVAENLQMVLATRHRTLRQVGRTERAQHGARLLARIQTLVDMLLL